MAYQTFPGGMYFPTVPLVDDVSLQFTSLLINAASESVAGIFQAPKTGTIDKVGFLTGTVTTGDTVDMRLETVSTANGDPTGTLLGTNSNKTQVVGAGDDNTWFLPELTTGVAVTKGDVFAVVVVNGGAGGDMSIQMQRLNRAHGFPYGDHFPGAWAKDEDCLVTAFEYSDGSYAAAPGVNALLTLGTTTFNSADTPDEIALYFQLPFPFRVTGYWISLDLDGDCDMVLYDSDGTTALQTDSLDKDIRRAATRRRHLRLFSGTSELLAKTNYRLSCKPGTTDVTIDDFTVSAAVLLDGMDGGQNFHLSTRANAGSWTQTTTKRPLMGVLIDAIGTVGGVGGLVMRGVG